MTQTPLVFLFDVDNTLLNNDQVTVDLSNQLDHHFGTARREEYFKIFEELRQQVGYADYLGALQRYRIHNPTDSQLLKISSFLVDYPFADRLYHHALQAIEHCKKFGLAAILSDGDVVFQPRKIERSGISKTVGGNVLIYIHKEQMLADVEARYPAAHYVMIDDKLRILTALKNHWGRRVTTIFPRQGHYAMDEQAIRSYPPADITIESIGQLLELDLTSFTGEN